MPTEDHQVEYSNPNWGTHAPLNLTVGQTHRLDLAIHDLLRLACRQHNTCRRLHGRRKRLPQLIALIGQ